MTGHPKEAVEAVARALFLPRSVRTGERDNWDAAGVLKKQLYRANAVLLLDRIMPLLALTKPEVT